MPFPQDPPASHAEKTSKEKPIIKQESFGDNSPNVVAGDNSTVTINAPAGWRDLADKEASAAANYLSSVPGVKVQIIVPTGDNNRMELADQLRDILAAAKWKDAQVQPLLEFGDGVTPSPYPMDGILILAQDATPAAQRLLNVLGHLYGPENVHSAKRPEFSPNYIQVTIRSKKRKRRAAP